MKKLFVAAAATALSGAASAQSSVTLYGLIDTGIGYANVDGTYTDPATGRRTSIDNSRIGSTTGTTAGSRWGLRGKEDLGDGLYAVFQLESGFDSRNGSSLQNSRLFGREATVGLGSAEWGEIRLGRQYNVAARYFSGMFGSSFGGGFNQLSTGAGLGFSSAYYVRYDNLVVYETPSLGGFKAAVGYAFNADDRRTAQTGFATADNTRAITAGLRYDNGPLMGFATYDQLNASNQLNQNQVDATPRSYIVGGSYDFEVFKVALAYNRITDGWFAGKSLPNGGSIGTFTGTPSYAFAKGFRSNSYMLAVAAPVGKSGGAFASWQRADANSKQLTGGDSASNTYSLGYNYNLSKRTDLYAVASYTTNWAFLDNAKATEVNMGIRHRF
ncbi:Outer membrane porin protein [Achromobacter deleyi]|uniref:Outer membrane porin protein n=1 Tax=Achromobacter deleyi TaxID=1353891 RepID=A0A6S7AN67_9BURK|nr:porin [Achromobacter deleyi]CAB3736054.1 Outer membrane porin protein [Achromobacter deleyi]CAB3914243.1 Outer membrane porin protein [Achromobacter deleyi]CAB3919466.1 Outer membrane porin protein [Achromobacter deleyi]